MSKIEIDTRHRPRVLGKVETSMQLSTVCGGYFAEHNDLVEIIEYDILNAPFWGDPVQKYAYRIKLKCSDLGFTDVSGLVDRNRCIEILADIAKRDMLLSW